MRIVRATSGAAIRARVRVLSVRQGAVAAQLSPALGRSTPCRRHPGPRSRTRQPEARSASGRRLQHAYCDIPWAQRRQRAARAV